jgi:quercetin dioxygenase-like cupin family protein
MSIYRWNAALDGELSERALRRKLEALGYRVARYVYPRGTVFPDHTHGVDKVDAVVSGKFRLVISGHVALLGAGDWIDIPRGAVHSAVVQGDEPVVAFDAIKIDPNDKDIA